MAQIIGKRKVEKIAANFVESFIDQINFMDYDFKVDDKGISWDGDIYLYNESIDKKTNYYDSISVQIKGRTTTNSNFKESINFDAEKADLINFLTRDGTLYFVVKMTNYEKKQLYYCKLLPFDLERILKGTDNMDVVKIKMKKIKDINHFEKMVRNFSIDKKMQKSANKKAFAQNNILINNKPSTIGFYDWHRKGESIFELVGEEKYLYQYDENHNIISVLCNEICAVGKKLNFEIKSKDGEVLYNEVNCTKTSDSELLSFGGAFTLNFTNSNFIIKVQGTLNERLKQLEIIEIINKDGGYYIDDKFVNFKITDDAMANFRERKDIYNTIKHFLINHNMQKDIRLDDWGDKDLNDFLVWIGAIDFGKRLRIDEFETSTIGSIQIKDFRFSVFANKNADNSFNVYSLWNYNTIKDKYIFSSQEGNKKICTNNIYSVLNEDAYLSDDINIEEMKNSYKEYHFLENEEIMINAQVLNLISAYDSCKNGNLLEYALYLLDMLNDFIDMKDTIMINRYQIYKRQGILNDEHIKNLIKLREDNDDVAYKVSANLLIGNILEAKTLFEDLSEENRKIFLSYPIAYFFNENHK